MQKDQDIPFGVPRELVTEDSDAVNGTARLEVLLNFLWRRRVVNLPSGHQYKHMCK